jgi:hypothetical protein
MTDKLGTEIRIGHFSNCPAKGIRPGASAKITRTTSNECFLAGEGWPECGWAGWYKGADLIVTTVATRQEAP